MHDGNEGKINQMPENIPHSNY